MRRKRRLGRWRRLQAAATIPGLNYLIPQAAAMPLISKKPPKPAKRTPLKSNPAPLPGQSSEEQLQRLLYDKGLLWLMIAVLPAMFAGIEWWRWLFAVRPQPIGFSVLAVLAAAVAVWRLRGLRGDVGRLQLGIDGERWVGQFLEALRPRGYQVFHDIAEDGFNIDHALIGPAGIFSIETKTVSKVKNARQSIVYDGQSILIDGWPPSRDPIVQAQAAASHLRRLLEPASGLKRLPIRPVVLYPGWFVQRQPKGAAVWVLNPEALPAFLDYEDQTLSDEQIRRLAFLLTEHVKARRQAHA